MLKFEYINPQKRIELEKILYEIIAAEDRLREPKKECYEFMVSIEGISFRTYMSAMELREAIACSIDLLEELKAVNNGGIDSAHFKEIQIEKRKILRRFSEAECEIFLELEIINGMYTEKMREIKSRMAKLCRVEGSWYASISSPLIDNIICIVYERIVDCFDDEELYIESTHFLLRGIMKMRSEDLPVE